MISTMGDEHGRGKGSFATFDSVSFEPLGLWTKDSSDYGYDYWYQPTARRPHLDGVGLPLSFSKGFDPRTSPQGNTGRTLTYTRGVSSDFCSA
nr:methanethiol oxidase-like [Penaeus vannamei]